MRGRLGRTPPLGQFKWPFVKENSSWQPGGFQKVPRSIVDDGATRGWPLNGQAKAHNESPGTLSTGGELVE